MLLLGVIISVTQLNSLFVFSPIQQLPWHSNIMADKGLNVFCSAKCVYLSPRKKSAPPLPDGTVKWTHLAPKQVHRGRQLK